MVFRYSRRASTSTADLRARAIASLLSRRSEMSKKLKNSNNYVELFESFDLIYIKILALPDMQYSKLTGTLVSKTWQLNLDTSVSKDS